MINLIFWFAAAVSAVESRRLGTYWNDEFHPTEEIVAGSETQTVAQTVTLTLTLDAQDKKDTTPKQLVCSYEPCSSLDNEDQIQVFKTLYNDEFRTEEEDGNVRYLGVNWNSEFHPSSCPEKLPFSQDLENEEQIQVFKQSFNDEFRPEDEDGNERLLGVNWNSEFHPDSYCLTTAMTPSPLGTNVDVLKYSDDAASVRVIPLLWAGNMLLFAMM